MFNRTISGLSAGNYSYKWWAYGNGTLHNFNVSNTQYYTIATATSSVYTYINGLRANKIDGLVNQTYWINATRVLGDGNMSLEVNGVSVNSSFSGNLSNLYNFTNVGNINITAILKSSTNYTSSSETFFITISAKPIITNAQNFTIFENQTIGFQFQASGAIDNWQVNNTNFKINQTGYFENNTVLSTITIHYVNISVNDTSGNYDSFVSIINVTKAPTNITFAYYNSLDNNDLFDLVCFKLKGGTICFNSTGIVT